MSDVYDVSGTEVSEVEVLPAVVEGQVPTVSRLNPAEAVQFAKEAAEVLVDVVKQCDLAADCGGSKPHIMLEGWSTVAKFYGCTIKCTDTQPIGEPLNNGRYPGFRATAVVIDRDGNEVGSGDGFCMRDERNWKARDNYALASMAQTRAASKAARVVFSWVVVLAGYCPTPVEEMIDGAEDGIVPEKNKPKQRRGETVVDTTAKPSEPIDPLREVVRDAKKVSSLFSYLRTQKIEKEEFGEYLLTVRNVGDTRFTRAPIDATQEGKPRWDRLSEFYFNWFKGNKQAVVRAFFGWKSEQPGAQTVEGSDVVKPSDEQADLFGTPDVSGEND